MSFKLSAWSPCPSPNDENENREIITEQQFIPADDVKTRALPRNGISANEVLELIDWLGPQAHKLLHNARLVEFFGGTKHRVTREAKRRGHTAIVIGLAHGQDLRGKRALRLSSRLLDYSGPEDIMVVWVCSPWSLWAIFIEAKGDHDGTDAGDRIGDERREGRQFLVLFHRLWRQQLRAGRHAASENQFDSLAFLEKKFLSGQFPKEAWWSCLDQCQVGLCPSSPGGHLQRHRKRTCFVSSREQSLLLLSKICGPQFRGIFEHIALSGGWNGRALTSWAEDYPPELAGLLCDVLSIEGQSDALALPSTDDITDADQAGRDHGRQPRRPLDGHRGWVLRTRGIHRKRMGPA